MSPQPYWIDNAVRDASARIEGMKAAMQAQVGRPSARRPNTTELIQQQAANPQAMPPQGRERLGQYLVDTYGEGGRILAPYLGLNEAGKEE